MKYNCPSFKGAVIVHQGQNKEIFWGKSDVFLRSTTTDIEGISVKEALMLNTSVIATDVVERPKGVDLYTYGDIEILSELILNKLRFGTPETFKDDISTGIDKIDKIYNILIN
jgi:hypothetical protein